MSLLQPRIDTTGISFWLGHANTQTTQTYPHADLELEHRALERVPTLGQ